MVAVSVQSRREYLDADLFLAESSSSTHARLIKWAEWANNNHKQKLHADIEAIEKSVGHLQFCDEPMLKKVTVGFYIERRSVESLAEELDISEFHCREYLRRAIQQLSKDIPEWDKRVQCNYTSGNK